MTTLTDSPGADALRAELVRALVDRGALSSPRWRAAFTEVPRHLFVPGFTIRTCDGTRTQLTADDPKWLQEAYADNSLVTQHDATGAATSSSSQPRLMACMLEMLDVDDATTVLDVGTGTGYNTALLCHGLGDQQVTSIDVDRRLVDEARARLHGLGYRPHLAVADGLAGYSPRAPYDRILGTCATHRIPTSWLRHTAPGGLIVTPVGYGVVALEVAGDHQSACGRFHPDPAVFMPARSAGTTNLPSDERADLVSGRGSEVRSTELFDDVFDEGFAFVVAAAVPNLAAMWDQPGGWYAVVDDPTRAWARAERAHAGAVVNQAGPRRLWDELERTYQAWDAAGRPTRDRLGLTVTSDGAHTLWVDRPDGPSLPLI